MADKGSADLILAAGGRSDFLIALPEGANQTLTFAAEELQRYLELMSGVRLFIYKFRAATGLPAIALARDDETASRLLDESPVIGEPDAFRLRASPEGVLLTGQRPRAALFAVYGLLERLGCRWLGPGDETVPKLPTIALENQDVFESPDFPHRNVFEDATHLPLTEPAFRQRQLEDDTRQLDWMAKVRLNGFYFFRWDPYDPSLDDVYPELLRRDLDMIGGGHIIPFLMPRSLYERHPEYFRMNIAGERVPDGNFCVSNHQALQIVCDNAVRLARARPHLALLHLWADDVLGGSWCSCPECRKMTAQDQYVTVCNAIIAALRQAGLKTEVAIIAYLDTLAPDLSVPPHPELHLTFAPRQRCYAHPIDETTCERNAWHRENVERWLLHIPSGNLAMFEYYMDAILFRSLGITIPGTILADLRDYHGLGVRRSNAVVTCPTYSCCAHPLNALAYAKGCWSLEADLEGILDDYCWHAYGPAAGLLKDYWKRMEGATGRLATHGPWPEMSNDEPMRALIQRVKSAPPELKRAGLFLEKALELELELDAPARWRVLRERAIWEFTNLQACALAEHLQALYYLGGAEKAHLKNRCSREPDDTYISLDLVHQRILHNSRPSKPRGYDEAIAHMESAIDFHERSRKVLMQALPVLMDSTWISAPLGFQFREDEQIRELRTLKDLAEEHLSGYV